MFPPASSRSAMRLQVKGALREDALYIERSADFQLESALHAGEYCYILAPRQIGKSSLRLHTARALGSRGILCIHIDLTLIGGHDDQESLSGWYFSLLSTIASQLSLADPLSYWQRRDGALPVFHFSRYLRTEVLAHIAAPIVIFIDEIDYLKSLPFDTDEFIDAIRGCYDTRGEDKTYSRLTFCLLGVVAPGDLIRNPQITPFNIGQPIALSDFCREELDSFAPMLTALGGDSTLWLNEIYRWTAGHPYMTQALCQHLCTENANASLIGNVAQQVERSVNALFLRRGRIADPNLGYAEKRLESQSDPLRKAELLAMYRRLLERQVIAVDNGSSVQQELQLCGMAAQQDLGSGMRTLRVRNRVFARVFDLEWLCEKETQRKLTQAMRIWYDAGRSHDVLLRGIDLEEAQAWASEHGGELTQEENLFLRASLDDARRDAEQRRLFSEASNERRIVIGLSVAVVLLLGLLGALYFQFRKAELEAGRALLASQKAVAATQVEKSLRASALVIQPGNQLQALVTGMQAVAPVGQVGLGQQWEGINRAVEESTLSMALHQHSAAVWSAKFSPNGQRVVTASADRLARVFDAQTGRLLFTLDGYGATLFFAAFSADGLRIVTAGADRTARVFDAKDGRLLLTLAQHSLAVLYAAFSPDGQRIVTASEDQRARVFDAKNGQLLLTLTEHFAAVKAAAFSPDGQRIVTASEDQRARVFDAKDGRLLFALPGHTAAVLSVGYSFDNKRLITASEDSTARVFDAKDGRLLLALAGHNGAIKSAAFSPDNRRIVTASEDQTMRVFDAEDGRPLFSLLGHTDWVLFADFSPDSQRIVSASYDRTARIWDITAGRLLIGLQGHSARVRSAVFSPDGQRIVTASDDLTARLWDAKDGRLLRTLSGHADSVRSAAFSPDGQRVATASYDRTAKIWETKTGNLQLTLAGHRNSVRTAAFSPDGQRIVTASFDRTAGIWDAQTGQLLLSIPGHDDVVRSAVFSPDNQHVATGSDDHLVRLFDAKSGRLLKTLSGHIESVRSVLFSADGKQLVSSSIDRTARIWDVKDGRQLLILQGHAASLRSAMYSPDGQRIVTSSIDGTARIWDAKDGHLILTLQGHPESVRSAAFSPDGQRIITAGNDTPLIHPIQTEQIYAFGCKLLRRLGYYPDIPEAEIKNLLATCASQD